MSRYEYPTSNDTKWVKLKGRRTKYHAVTKPGEMFLICTGWRVFADDGESVYDPPKDERCKNCIRLLGLA